VQHFQKTAEGALPLVQLKERLRLADQPLKVKGPAKWPRRVFNVRAYGAKGDDVTDETRAIRAALAAAEKNGAGVAYSAERSSRA
jgi:hypothetical protein